MALILLLLALLFFLPGLFVGGLKLLLVVALLCVIASAVTYQRR